MKMVRTMGHLVLYATCLFLISSISEAQTISDQVFNMSKENKIGENDTIGVRSTTFSVKYYNVVASSEKELFEAITSKSPLGSSGLTEIVPVSIDYKVKKVGSGYVVDTMTVSDKIIQTFPIWTNKSSGKQCLQDQWDKLIIALTKHEDNHKNKYAEYGPSLIAIAKAIAPQATPMALKKVLVTKNDQLKVDIQNWQVQYDKTTKFGQMEGVMLSNCS